VTAEHPCSSACTRSTSPPTRRGRGGDEDEEDLLVDNIGNLTFVTGFSGGRNASIDDVENVDINRATMKIRLKDVLFEVMILLLMLMYEGTSLIY
jgi:hypothetical protein